MRERIAALLGLRQQAARTPQARQQHAVAAMVEHGPVLDLSLGAGPYLDIYRAKGIDAVVCDISDNRMTEARENHQQLGALKGTIFNLPFGDGQFATVVCCGLLNRLGPDDMARAIAEIRRVGREIVVSVRTAKEDRPPHGGPLHDGTFTHGLDTFYAGVEGLFIADREVIETQRDETSEMYRLRPPLWADVVRQFDWHPDGHDALARLTRKWCDRYHIAPVDVSRSVVRAEYWTHDQIADLIDNMARVPRVDSTPNRMKTADPPRIDGGPMTVFRTQGRTALIDGRRRANRWMCKPGRYPVLLIEA